MSEPVKYWPSAHRCPWPGCPAQVGPDLWGCKAHWFRVPRELRMRLWRAYTRGQSVATASQEYLDAAAAINAWIAGHVAQASNAQSRRGHGWVTPNPDGSKTRCGGPALCHTCQAEARALSKLDERQGDLL